MHCRFFLSLIAALVASTAITTFAYSSCGTETTETIQIPFLTEYQEPVIFAEFRHKCRKPKSVVVTLLEGYQNEERDRISLDMVKDFTKADANAYKPRLDIVLHGAH